MDLPALWALELSPQARRLLHQLQGRAAALTTQQQPSPGHAGTMLRDALLRGLNELARQEGLKELEIASERELEGTHVSPVLINPTMTQER